MGKTIMIVCMIVCLLALLLLVACGNKSSPSTMPVAPGNDAKTTTGSDQGVASGAQVATDSGSKPSGNVASAFTGFLGKRAGASWMVSYKFTTVASGRTVTSTMTQYLKDGNTRTDTVTEGVESRTYYVDKTYTSCTDNGNWTCFKSDASQDNLQATTEEIQDDISDYNVVADGTKTIAGATATCYSVKSVAAVGMTYQYCFSKEGVPLSILFDGMGVRTEMVATSYSTSVSDSDFTPPVAPMQMPLTGDDPCSVCNFLTGSQKEACLAAC